MKLSDFDFELPEDRIALHPVAPRHAARMLVVGGRLVYFLAAAPGFYSEEEVPRHPMLEVGEAP